MKMQHIFGLLLMILSVTFFVSDVSASKTPIKAPVGKWEANADAKKSFETGKYLPDYTYYYLGSNLEPESVIAINNQYKLRDSRVWAKVDEMSDKVVKGWLQAWKADGHESSDLNGGVILTPDGKKAGIWYSHYPANIVRMPEPGVLEVFQPHPFSGSPTGQD